MSSPATIKNLSVRICPAKDCNVGKEEGQKGLDEAMPVVQEMRWQRDSYLRVRTRILQVSAKVWRNKTPASIIKMNYRARIADRALSHSLAFVIVFTREPTALKYST